MPVVVTRMSPITITPQNPTVLVSVSNLLGQPVGELTVTAESAKRKEDGAVVISKQKLAPKASDLYAHRQIGPFTAPVLIL